ncbi:LON peptidase substrate-binding domain-containing protein [Flexithrix dorotheae]|uniref:LON peptidase substrate-binding domain-containing protein n=1 Tax=Flexithrix dorotheae TaxID=70993 RepID=UPI000382D0FA|nr:LON peptidase substrate-binding domain-containing protein [Flexithrix dorotheae]
MHGEKSSKIPIFPLNVVVFPGEDLNLHIFEPRYKALIKDCIETGISFGIPAYLDGKVQNTGTTVRLVKIVNKYPDGRMDIITKAEQKFRMLNFEPEMGSKLYAGGEVEFLEISDNSNHSDRVLLIETVQKLFRLLQIDKNDLQPEMEFLSFKIGHHVGLTLKQEFRLLSLEKETQRMDLIIDHLIRTIPAIRAAEKSKEKVKLNGHFKYFDPLKF